MVEPLLVRFLHPYFTKKYQNRYYSQSKGSAHTYGIAYMKDEGTYGNVANDFSLVPNIDSTAVYVSETRGLVFAQGANLQYLVIEQS